MFIPINIKKNLSIKDGQNQTRERKIEKRNISFIQNYSIIILISFFLSINCKRRIFYFTDSYITLKINKTGVINIYQVHLKAKLLLKL